MYMHINRFLVATGAVLLVVEARKLWNRVVHWKFTQLGQKLGGFTILSRSFSLSWKCSLVVAIKVVASKALILG